MSLCEVFITYFFFYMEILQLKIVLKSCCVFPQWWMPTYL